MRRHPYLTLKYPGKVIGAERSDRCQVNQRYVTIKVSLNILTGPLYRQAFPANASACYLGISMLSSEICQHLE
jgi:hypothetical protein